MKLTSATIIFRRESGKSQGVGRTEIANRFCSSANSSGTNLQDACQEHELDKAFHNPALCVVAIPNWQANPDLYSNRAIEVLPPRPLVTNPFFRAISSPVCPPSFLRLSSLPTTVAGTWLKIVFTSTQLVQRLFTFTLALNDAKCLASLRFFRR